MLEYIIAQTADYLAEMPKTIRKKIGQFFTSCETAQYMAQLFDFSILDKDTVEILDPGTGSGILSAALLDRIISTNLNINTVKLTCYETNENILPILKENIEYIKIQIEGKFNFIYEIKEEDYILSQAADFEETLLAKKNPKKYDIVIGNPPYLRVLRSHAAAMSMPKVVHGAPNLYFLFASMSLFNLKPEKEMVYIIPRSWTSGAYFEAFRNYFLMEGKLTQLHLFVSRDKVFSQEEVLQETMILKIKKTQIVPTDVLVTSSHSNSNFSNITELVVPYSTIVAGASKYVYLPTSKSDMYTIQAINQYKQTLPERGYRMKTGIVVDFRQWDELRKEPGEGVIPLFYSQHIKNGRVNHEDSGKGYDWIIDSVAGLIQRNKDYVFCKRFTAKEERRRLQCGLYYAHDFPDYEFIGTQNKINFIDSNDKTDIPEDILHGIFALLNSTLFDNFYRILNGSTQVNSTEINSIPVPPLEKIKEIGERIIESGDLSTEKCDKVLEEVAYGKIE